MAMSWLRAGQQNLRGKKSKSLADDVLYNFKEKILKNIALREKSDYK
jgi:hypothetical protein